MNRRPTADDRGSVLMLVPAGVLVLVILGSIAIDSAVILLAQRDLSNRTAATAGDIANSAIDDEGFYAPTATVGLDARKAAAYVRLVFAPGRRPATYRRWDGDVAVEGRTVTVVATAEVDLIFAKAIPGATGSTTVRARSVATAQDG